ncbi:class I SAM-dependent methyltransferase [Lysobacter solisilvae (ex Woo and Kim 2020)]|uniref:Methyltransferase domain-containing protein n=1 Tax=Agrilutibacter terrestris TaxID=2865112 RepID=A0A7H0G0H5_9GAMM|nr:methyltransferase domain-containing protein [Lysobacter terrestris]QNP41791.1 methyltransferase domain-containing protein [Lysobacter terrestris]
MADVETVASGTRLVFAPDAVLRFARGRMLIHTASAGQSPFVTDQPMLIGWLAQFAQPSDAETALARLPAESRALAARALAYLRQSGALREAGIDADVDDADLHARSREQLTALTQGVYELGCDVAGFGPHAEQALRLRGGIGLESRLQALRAAVADLRGELAMARGPYLESQLQALGVDAHSRELNLHIGCGPYLLPGWVNIDIHPAPLATNVLWGLPFAADSARHVFLSHLLEHLFYPNDVHPFLVDVRRVLAPGGIVRIVVPDIAQCIDAYQRDDAEFFAARREHWGTGDGQTTRLEDFLAYAGAGPDPAWLFQAHKFGYDFATLQRALQRAGFVDIERSSFNGSRHPALQVDANSEVAGADHGGQHYSLFVEARKPGGAA